MYREDLWPLDKESENRKNTLKKDKGKKGCISKPSKRIPVIQKIYNFLDKNPKRSFTSTEIMNRAHINQYIYAPLEHLILQNKIKIVDFCKKGPNDVPCYQTINGKRKPIQILTQAQKESMNLVSINEYATLIKDYKALVLLREIVTTNSVPFYYIKGNRRYYKAYKTKDLEKVWRTSNPDNCTKSYNILDFEVSVKKNMKVKKFSKLKQFLTAVKEILLSNIEM